MAELFQGAIPNGYGVRIDRLKKRLDNPGANKQKLRNRISDLRAQKYLKSEQRQQKNQMLPFNAEYDTTVSGAARNRDIALQNNAYERQMAQQNYGFDNPAANPYSRASLLQRSFDQFNKGTVNSAAASGQLYSGATQNDLDAGMFDFGQQYNALQSDYQGVLRDLVNKDLAANVDYNDTVQGAEAKRLADALAQGIDPNAAPDDPKNVKRFIRDTRKDIRQARRAGRYNQADKLRAKLRKLGVGRGR